MGAKKVKKDEKCIGHKDVEKKFSTYKKSVWRHKVVLCECDHPPDDGNRLMSAFPMYFILNFKELGLKKLICIQEGKYGYVFTKNGFYEINKYTGSFDDPLSLKIPNDDDVDIVCTKNGFGKLFDARCGLWFGPDEKRLKPKAERGL